MKSKAEKTQKRVYVGMSGGVDSSVSAALLMKAGFDVTGVFIKVWQPDWIECNWREDRLEAMRAAAHLGIPFLTLDLEQEYKTGVIDYMIAEYAAGRTPNPDVMCNREVKFGGFMKWAMSQGADFVATGHYAQILPGTDGELSLFAGKDDNKDQSYFLWTLRRELLKKILFPVGHLEKSEVRKLAKRFGLPNADKKDSQGLCFIGKVDVKEFIKHYVETKPGVVLNESGKVIGTHPGALLFTIGERHGFTLTEKTPEDRPYFVVSKDVAKNTLTVSDRTLTTAKQGFYEATLRDINWTSIAPAAGTNILARHRYRAPLEKASIVSISATGLQVRFEKTQETLTPGQSLVMYAVPDTIPGDGDDQECLGGGIIV